MSFTTLKALRTVACCGISRSMVASRSVSVPVTRWYTSVPQPYQHITLKCNNQNGVSVLEMKKKPVNSLSLEFLTELNICLEKITNDKSIRGLIITSALPVFSAGLDIMELYQPREDRLRTYWHNVQELILNLHSSPKIVMTAVEGPCIAGGCMFVWGSDYRIMSEGKHTIGLNEARLVSMTTLILP
ncbi:hypothetical protein LSH36_529g01034 [Paralvinella palmiformis]|uniref:Uncharacterized protein n=1 Tax=Paralvinella palmiformis TaxID=53620 RepID=A0AAD9MXK8_9ANNE|nr:hypothetical protein LSH36_529g01034 [Paralvinella palmiformis]